MRLKYSNTKQNNSPYASIDWSKAKTLLDRPILNEGPRGQKRVFAFLQSLVQGGDTIINYLVHADNPRIVERLFTDATFPDWRKDQLINRLQKQHYIAVTKDLNGNTTVKITKDGRIKALTYALDTMHLVRSSHWDKKWRIVIFDVPELHHKFRDTFRVRLRQLGMYKLQESVYVSPYPCFEEIEFLRELFQVAVNVIYIVADSIENDKALIAHFQLS